MKSSRKLMRKSNSYPVLKQRPSFVFPTYTESDILAAVENTKKITSEETISMTLAIALDIIENHFSVIMKKANRLDNFANLYIQKASEFERDKYKDIEKILREKYDLKVIYEEK